MNFSTSSSSFSSLDLKALIKPKTRSKNSRHVKRRSRFSLLRIFSSVRYSSGLSSYLSRATFTALSHRSWLTARFTSSSFWIISLALSKSLRSTFIPSVPIGVSISCLILSGSKISILPISTPTSPSPPSTPFLITGRQIASS